MMRQIRVGIIGTGNIASTGHMPAINSMSQVSLVAVLSRSQESGANFLQKHSVSNATVYTSLDSFVSSPDIDLVIVCSPDKLHFEQTSACLSSGKHVLLEKPITTNEAEVSELIELAEKQRLVLATGFHLRSHVGHRMLLEAIASGEIGELRHIRAIWAFPQSDDSNWRAKDDLAKWWSLSAVGSHCIDLTRWFAQDEEDWRSFSPVVANNLWNGPHDETAVISGQLASGPTVEIVSSVQFGPYNRLELFGSKGHAICEGTMGREGAGTIIINGKELEFERLSPFVEQLKNIIECIDTNKSPRADALSGKRSVKDLLLAACPLV